MTAREAAQQIGVSYSTVLRLIDEEMLGHQRLGPKRKMIRVSQEDVDAYLAAVTRVGRVDGQIVKLQFMKAK
jgi:excisionase family DNA binding protein